MMALKCKMCGGELNITENSTIAKCMYCGSKQTVPVLDNEKKATLYARAHKLRYANEFDKASNVYENIVAEFPDEAEAYWGIVLCSYGIEYVDDVISGEKIPTCHRSSFLSIFDDDNFEMVMENADSTALKVYRDEAKKIEEIRKGIIEVSSKEEPYDIFICYKETDENGERTLDSVIAQDVYTSLSEKGYRVFFSRISLEDKLGMEYEPYIFAALNSAKIMLVFGTKYEYFNTVWVKNEWSRFLKMISAGEKKILIPCYKNIDIYDMPKEFAKLQAQDFGKVGAIQDLLRGINKILPKEDYKLRKVINDVVPLKSNIDVLLNRGMMALQDMDWQKAHEIYDQVLNQNEKCAEAYLGQALARYKCINTDVFVNQRLKNTVSVAPKKSRADVVIDTCVLESVRQETKKYTLNKYFTEEDLLNVLTFPEEKLFYISELDGREQQLQKEKEFFCNDTYFSKAIKFAHSETAEEIKKLQERIFSVMEDRIAKEKKEDLGKVAKINEAYNSYFENIIEDVKMQYDWALKKYANDYWNAYEKMKRGKYYAAKVEFEALGDYEDSKALAQKCESMFDFGVCLKKMIKRGIVLAILAIIIFFTVSYLKNINARKDASKLLQDGHYEKAIEALDIWRIDEKTEEMLSNIYYQWGKKLVEEKKYLDAYAVLNSNTYWSSDGSSLKEELKRTNLFDVLQEVGLNESVHLGKYHNQNIFWEVLDKKDGNVLLLCSTSVDCQAFGTSGTWEKSNVRQWLNEVFLTSFSEEELNHLNDKINGDKISLLTSEEVYTYFPTEKDRANVYCSGRSDFYPWWTKTVKSNGYDTLVDVVSSDGLVMEEYQWKEELDEGYYTKRIAVRPIIWVKTNE